MGTPLSDREREQYAKPGTLLKKMLDDGTVDWPTREELEYENLAIRLLSGEWVEIPLGTMFITGRRAVMEIGFQSGMELSWRVVPLDPAKPEPPEDQMGAPDFPLPSPDEAFGPRAVSDSPQA